MTLRRDNEVNARISKLPSPSLKHHVSLYNPTHCLLIKRRAEMLPHRIHMLPIKIGGASQLLVSERALHLSLHPRHLRLLINKHAAPCASSCRAHRQGGTKYSLLKMIQCLGFLMSTESKSREMRSSEMEVKVPESETI